jgi:sporulation protein YlmC with PRC-barrel domain
MSLDLVRMVLDHQLVDANGNDCGRVDDVELEQIGSKLKIRAIVAGPSSAASGLWPVFRLLVHKLFGKTAAKIPWQQVAAVDSRVHLRCPAEAFGLLDSEKKAARWISRLPRSGGE